MVNVKRVELVAYQLKTVVRTLFDQCKDGKAEDTPHPSWIYFEEAFLGRLFPQKLKEAKVWEFLTLKKDSMSVHEYRFKFTHLSCYAPKMVKYMRSRMFLFAAGLGRPS